MSDMNNAAPVAVNSPGLPDDQRRLIELDDAIAKIRTQIATADLARQRGQKPIDPDWFHRALYVAVCKDTDALHVERIEADRAMAERLLEKAGRIIFAQRPPARISEDPAWFECRFCDHHAACHDGGGAAVTCRSCLHATPVDGGWHCARYDRMLAPSEQRASCGRHLFIPDLIAGEVIDAGDDAQTAGFRDLPPTLSRGR